MDDRADLVFNNPNSTLPKLLRVFYRLHFPRAGWTTTSPVLLSLLDYNTADNEAFVEAVSRNFGCGTITIQELDSEYPLLHALGQGLPREYEQAHRLLKRLLTLVGEYRIKMG